MIRLVIFLFAAALGVASGCVGQFESCYSTRGTNQCCSSPNFCMPWNATFWECFPTPEHCQDQYTNLDFYEGGSDIKTVYDTQPYECCDFCFNTTGCVAYTLINDNGGRPACYLKRGIGYMRTRIGAVSALMPHYKAENDLTARQWIDLGV